MLKIPFFFTFIYRGNKTMDDMNKNRKIALYTFLELVALFTLTMLASMWDWVNMGFSLAKIQTKAYWNEVIMNAVMYSCALILGNLLKLEKLELKDKAYYDLLHIYRTDKLNYKDENFVSYIMNVLNPRIKKEFLKKKYENKLARLEKYSLDSFQLCYNTCKENENFDAAVKAVKNPFKRFYCRRRNNLEHIRSDEYIEKHYQSMFVRYPKVNPYSFTYYLNIKMNDRTKYQTENKTARDMGIKLTRKIVYSILGATILALLIISPDTNQLLEQANGWIAVVIQYIIRVGMIIANFVMGIYNAKTIFNDNYLRPINNRIRMLDEYQIYKTENKWQSKADIEEEINKRVKEKVEPLQEMVNQLEQRQIQ